MPQLPGRPTRPHALAVTQVVFDAVHEAVAAAAYGGALALVLVTEPVRVAIRDALPGGAR